MPFKADFTDMANREPVPANDYRAEIIGADIEPPSETAKANGSTYDGIQVKFKLTEGEYEGRQIKRKFSLSPKAMGFILDLWEACGMPQETGTTPDLDEKDLIGKELIITVGRYEQEKKPGKYYNEVDSVSSLY